jgi:hypothetical protein
MKSFLKLSTLAAGALLLAGTASASTIVGTCGSFDNPSPNASLSGTWTCPSFSSLGGGAGTITGEYLVYDSDYSNGLSSSVVAVTDWTFSGGTLAYGVDTTTSTGGSSSSQATSVENGTFNALVPGPPTILAGFYDTASAFGTLTVNYTNAATTGSALETTGYAQVVYTYTPSSIPEPGSLFLLGTGLLGAGLIGRKKFAGRKG